MSLRRTTALPRCGSFSGLVALWRTMLMATPAFSCLMVTASAPARTAVNMHRDTRFCVCGHSWCGCKNCLVHLCSKQTTHSCLLRQDAKVGSAERESTRRRDGNLSKQGSCHYDCAPHETKCSVSLIHYRCWPHASVPLACLEVQQHCG